ncbi:hypothetical protein MKZ38_000224 [Zalerion maritima]|uniref:2EXR domain-containing protein n=1 Tax=Zalerion maritima TaxID=339359 RepID=A0AAD5RFP4_9PEZI|nr:hypothetical protein MKZ38_000224 [Zalerion maritima]
MSTLMVQPWQTYRFIQSPSVKMPETFTKFRQLPPEIRLMIWQEALPDPRVFEVLDSPSAKQKTPPHSGLMFANVHHEAPPSLSAVCQESRDFVLRFYKRLTFSGTTKYLDPSRDVLLLEPYLLVKRLLRTLHFLQQIPQVKDQITRLALGTSYGVYTGICHPILSWKVSKNNVAKLLERLAKFPKLGSLVFIVHQDFRFEFDFRYMPLSCGCLRTMSSQSPYSFPTIASSSPNYSNHSNFGGSGYSYYRTPPTSPAAAPLPTPLPSLSPSSQRELTNAPQIPIPPPCQFQQPQPQQQQQQQQQQPSGLSSPSQRQTYVLSPVQTQHSSSTNSFLPQTPPTQSQAQTQTHTHTPNQAQPPPPSPPQPNLPSHSLPLHRPQIVHQAYRFKFDIETNINHHPSGRRRHHVNELLYYPLEVDDEEKEDRILDLLYHRHHLQQQQRQQQAQERGQRTGESLKEGDSWGEDEMESGPSGLGGLNGLGGLSGYEEDEEEDPEWSDPWPTNDDWKRFRKRFQRAINTTVAQAGFVKERMGGRRPPRIQGASLLWRYLGDERW